MTQTATPEQASTTHSAKRSAALFSVLAAFAVTLLKLLTGLFTGSLGMLSEAAHSGIDLVAAGITLAAFRPAADAVAEVSNPVCGDVMKLWVRIDGGRIQDAKFKAQGCSAAIATSSYATEMLIGMSIPDARNITKEQIADALGGLLASKIHCSVLASDAIRKVLEEF